jgi:hypothetical protein
MSKTFNIVFDSWENENTLFAKYTINLDYLNKKIVYDAVSYPWILSDFSRDFKVKNCKLSDVNKKDNYYYIIQHTYSYSYFIKNKTIDLSEEVKYQISNNNLKVMFVSPHESPEHLETFIEILNTTIKTNNWNESQFYIINNNSLIYNIKEKFNSNINFYKINTLLRLVSNDIKIRPNKTDIIFNKKFLFLCLNRKPHLHRIFLLSHLKNLKLLKNDIMDWSLVVDYTTYTHNKKNIQSIRNLKKYIEPDNKSLVKDYLEIIKNKKLSYYEQNVKWFDNIEDYLQIEHLTLDSYKNSYINILTESHYTTTNDIHITEKSFKPFYYFQIPIFLASYNHVKMLREEYDFYFFDDLIDHSYDNEIDYVKRFHMVVNEINRLSNMKEEISNYYKNNVDKLIHNHNFIKTYPERKIEENYFLNLINENK